ncbi:restriction endonuclease subunit S [Mammaliicoccus sciuri]|uniref:restriction endonuclease subunit S n=1 Tax=Mammaliicoccus sciuri TaxID=1296 RepID=UPI002B2624A3|nr:restriction endonuclease subunit S [Mammaliicoccus sciuri]WQL92664.1 restriction endonuclease subunit S [Mammaliicoccus sciuri]
MNKQTNTPELRFPEFDEEWKKRKLGEVVNYKNGGSFESLMKNHGVYKLITLKSVNTEGKLCNSGKYIDDKCVETLCNDTLVMILSEQAPGLVGMTAIILNNNEYVLNQRVAALVPKQFIDSQFLSKLINRNQKYFSVRSAGTKVKNISKGHVENFNFLSPNYTEQQKIGNFFSKLDCQIELEEQKLAKLEEQKKGYMQQIFSQQLRFKDENGNEYPEWEEKKLGDILERGNKDKVNEIGKYRRLTISLHGKGLYEVKQERKTKDTRPFYQRFEGELIIGKQNFFNGSIAIVTREFNGFICSNAIMSYKISNHMNRTYLLEYLLQNDFLRKNEYLADGTGQKELSEKKFEELEIKLPNSINEQQKIGVFLERLDNLIEKQSNKLELLKQRKKSFLQKMFV